MKTLHKHRMKTNYLLLFACVWAVARAHHTRGNLCETIRASQSSLADFRGYALNAIDRNHDPNYQHGSCSRTAMEPSPWWGVDFFYHYRVYVVKITSSGNGVGLRGAEIRIGDSQEMNGSKNQICARNVNVPPGESSYFYCQMSGVHGRYMTITIPGRTAFLSLCEVEAYGAYDPHSIRANYLCSKCVSILSFPTAAGAGRLNSKGQGMKSRLILLLGCLCVTVNFSRSHDDDDSAPENVIFGVRATQSTTFSKYGSASNAIDGNHDSEFHHSSCSCTKKQCNPWWRVDLQRHYRIYVVSITNLNRRHYRLNGAEIRIGDSLENNGNNNTLCAKITHIPAGQTANFYCEPAGVHGRYLNIFQPRCRSFLTLCEVEAFGAHDPH
ncbi:uncharacterized protein LOC132394941 [Hypanus sabinus]|uniref:uncharacterized protein LOC132394941 n=1 Tax=Hypanus sabinus TaxID=79690 RepID=UPI0028C4A898|nr:uncharacterized protein LOC132394941 [Hypanus sabinus]